jgi:hypothetical protein
MVDESLYDRITGQVSDLALYAIELPPDITICEPVATIQRVSNPPEGAIDGTVIRHVARYQISIFGQDLTAVRAAREAVKNATRGYKGGGIKGISIDNDFELEPDSGIHHVIIDLLVSH